MDDITRREFVRRVAAGAAGLAVADRLLASDAPAAASPAKGRPNIVWIYCDELRTDALGCYGHPTLRLHTPNLDRLAGQGVRFTNHFCTSPVCVPSRVASLTGRYPEDTGVYNNEAAWSCFRLPNPVMTFPHVFAQNGYRTANFGKIHVAHGMYPDEAPGLIFQHHDPAGGDMGFWQKLGEKAVRMIRSPNGGMNGGVFPDDVPYPPDELTTRALKWMGAAKGQPYLVRLSILQPHTPVLPPARFVKLYAGQDPGLPGPLPSTLSAFERRVSEVHDLGRMAPEKLREARLHYYAQVAWVDSQVGRVLEFLEQTGQRSNTIIVFGADHGNPLGDTGAFEKHTFTPTVHRVPFLVSWPGTLPAGAVRPDLSDSLDFGRTLFGLSGLDAPASFKGRNVFADPAPEAIFSTIGYGEVGSRMGPNGGRGTWAGGRGWPRRSCIRTARLRLDQNMRIDGRPVEEADRDVFLADVVADPREFTNLAADPARADDVRRLRALLTEHAKGAVEVPAACVTRPSKAKPVAEG